MPLIPSSALAVIFFCATGVCLFRKQFEHAITRLSIAMLYAYFSVFPDTSLEVTRNMARYFWFLLAFIEVLSFFLITHFRKRVKSNADSQ